MYKCKQKLTHSHINLNELANSVVNLKLSCLLSVPPKIKAFSLSQVWHMPGEKAVKSSESG